MYGIANVLLAGGRDTVIKLMTAMIWHLGIKAEDRKFLQSNPESLKTAITEVLRFVSPLPAMERAPASQKNLPDDQRNPDEYVRLSFASGNHDPEAFESPEVIDIHRIRNPHLSFGFGPHTCIGNHVAELETLSLLQVFLARIKDWEISKDSEITFTTVNKSVVPDRFHTLEIRALEVLQKN
jgi:cytochrome P450